MTSDPGISVVIPVKNEAAKIRSCIIAILSQSVRPQEIIVVDSGSTDGTLSILSEFPQVTVIQIPPSEFNHGETRNLGVRAASSEFVALTVGDAVPTDEHWLRRLLSGFTDDLVAGVCGRQIVHEDSRHNPLEWYRPVSEPVQTRFQFSSAEEFDLLSAQEKRRLCGWDDVTAMYRKTALLQIPFRKVTYAEDAAWAMDALRAGYAIVYEHSAQVAHYHIETAAFAYKRTLTALYHMYHLFAWTCEPRSIISAAMEAGKILIRRSPLSLIDRAYWVVYNLNSAFARRRAVHDFNDALWKGSEAMEQLHSLHCSIAPIPAKR